MKGHETDSLHAPHGHARAVGHTHMIAALLFALLVVVPHADIPAQDGGEATTRAEQLAFYQDYALIATNCQTWEEAYKVAEAVVAKGGTVSVILSPQYLLGWVPPESKNGIAALDRIAAVHTTPGMRKMSASGPDERAVLAGFEHFRLAKTGALPENVQTSTIPSEPLGACMDAGDGMPLVSFLTEGTRLQDSAAAVTGVSTAQWQSGIRDSLQSLLGIPPGVMTGLINVDVFMMESWGASSRYDWTGIDEYNVVTGWLRAFDFWSRAASRYGRSVTFRGSWFYATENTTMRVGAEPLTVAKDNDWTLIKQVMLNLGYDNPWGDGVVGGIFAFLTLGACIPCDLAAIFELFPEGKDREFIRVMQWNDKRAGDLHVRQSFSSFIKLRPQYVTQDFRAYCMVASSGSIGGRFTIPVLNITLRLDMVISPYIVATSRGGGPVFAHEAGHVFGAADEYVEPGDRDCAQPGYHFRGTANLNCEMLPQSVHAMMRTASESDCANDQMSSVTPVFVGWIPNTVPRTIAFRTDPPGIPMTLPIGIVGGETFTGTRNLYLGLGYTLVGASVPASATVGGTTYFFDAWMESGRRSVAGLRRTMTIDNTCNEYVARYTTGGSGITTANNTLEARLAMRAPATPDNRQFDPSVVLVWRSTLTDLRTRYLAQYESGGTWVDVTGSEPLIRALPLYCSMKINEAGGLIQNGRSYRFRVVPVTYAGARGTPSNAVDITTRPSSPAAGTYGYDASEPNNSDAAATSLTSNAGDPVRVVDGAIHYDHADPGYSFDTDVFRLAVNSVLGESVRISVTPKPGSLFTPYVTVQLRTSPTVREATRDASGSWSLRISGSGDHFIRITSRRSNAFLTDDASGNGHWGEYALSIQRVPSDLVTNTACPTCIGIQRVPTGGGVVYPQDLPPGGSRLFTLAGITPATAINFSFIAEPDPGFRFTDFEGDFPDTKNPSSRTIDPKKDPPGERMLIARFEPLPQGNFELVYEVPEAYRSILGETRRYIGASGAELDLAIPDAALNGFDFIGWDGTIQDGDIMSPADWRSAPAIRIKLTRNILLRPRLRPRPCTGGGLQPFVHALNIVNALKVASTLTYGMQPGASDSLESGQSELPPVPVSAVPDFRFLNIADASQGSLTDIRGMKAAFTFVGRLQPGDNGDPVTIAWDPIPSALPGTFTLTIGGAMIDMRSQISMTVPVGQSSTFKLAVTQDTCRELPKNQTTVQVSDVDASGYPYVRGRVCISDKAGNPLLKIRGADVQLAGKNGKGGTAPGYLMRFRPSDDCYEFEGFLDDGTRRDESSRQRGIIITVASAEPQGQSDGVADFPVPVPDVPADTGNGNGRQTALFSFPHAAGWQLVSIPLVPYDGKAASVFGDGTMSGGLYGFDPDAGYRATDMLAFGKGYWMKFSAAGTGRAGGSERTTADFTGLPGVGQAAANGWNLIGSLSAPVQRTSISETPAGAILSLFEFNGGYKPATVLQPGRGYWVKLQANSSLHLVKSFTGSGGRSASKSAAAGTPYEDVTGALPRVREWVVTDASGATARLFSTTRAALTALRDADLEAADLPPLPPASAFDARFDAGTQFSADNGHAILRVQGVFPMRLAVSRATGVSTPALLSFDDGTPVGRIDAGKDADILIPYPADGGCKATIQIRSVSSDGAAAVPSRCALHQSYPNPFTPGTTASNGGVAIAYAVAEGAAVTLTVYDALGRIVRVLEDGPRAPGSYVARWDGQASSGTPAPAGMYLYELRAGSTRLVNHLMIAK